MAFRDAQTPRCRRNKILRTELRSITPNGVITWESGEFYGWVIERFMEPYVEELNYECAVPLNTLFLCGAYRIAREVIGTGYDWIEASSVYASAAREHGIDDPTIELLLGKAWRLANAGFTHWTDLLREWVCVSEHRQMIHLPTGLALTDLEFGELFEYLLPVPADGIFVFLMEEGDMEMVSKAKLGASAGPTFEHDGDERVLRLPQVRARAAA